MDDLRLKACGSFRGLRVVAPATNTELQEREDPVVRCS